MDNRNVTNPGQYITRSVAFMQTANPEPLLEGQYLLLVEYDFGDGDKTESIEVGVFENGRWWIKAVGSEDVNCPECCDHDQIAVSFEAAGDKEWVSVLGWCHASL